MYFKNDKELQFLLTISNIDIFSIIALSELSIDKEL